MFKYLVFCIASMSLLGQIALQAPKQIPAGAPLKITWSGGSSEKEFITVVPEGTREGKYGHYQYNNKNTWQTLAPEQAGKYEIRYLDSVSPYKTLAMQPLLVTPVSASLKANPTAPEGSLLEITWEGPGNEKDFMTIVAKGTPEKKYGKYEYLRNRNPIQLLVPEQAGDYEIRYLSGMEYLTLAAKPLKVTAENATLEAPESAVAGSQVEIRWQGPDNKRDFITIVPADFPENKYKHYQYTENKNPVRLTAPDDPGNYEIRYLMGQTYRTLARKALTVISTTASLTFPESIEAGSMLEVKWQGPNNPRDFITVVEKGTPERKYGHYRYTASGNPITIRIPDEAGEYELRYLTGQTYQTLASASLNVLPTSASLDAPESVRGNVPFAVTWTGPDKPGDYISIAIKDQTPRKWRHFTYTRKGSPLMLMAPDEAGSFEIRYQMGQSNKILARRAVQVSPPEQKPGRLKVVTGKTSNGISTRVGVEVILDASGSMLKKINNERRIDIAKSVLSQMVTQTIPAGTPFVLRVFGHLEADSCRTDLLVPLAPLNPQVTAQKVSNLQAQNLAKTPIADSLALVASDMVGHKGQKTVVLITDGEETCGGDPAQVIEDLKAKGISVTVNIVGFAIEAPDLAQQFRYWSELGDGMYFDASDKAGLSASMDQAIHPVFTVWNPSGEKVGQGTVNGQELTLAPGSYQLKLAGQADQSIQIQPEKTTSIELH